MMEESSGNGHSMGEKVINILVIQEPQDWQKMGGEDNFETDSILSSEKIREDADRMEEDSAGILTEGLSSHINDTLYSHQSFFVDSHHKAAANLKAQSPMGHTVKVQDGKGEIRSSSFNKDYTHQSFPQYGINLHRKMTDQGLLPGNGNNILVNEDASCQKSIKLGRHKSISFPIKSESFSPPSSSFIQCHNHRSTATATNISSITEMTPQTFASSSNSSLPFSPVVVSSLSLTSSQPGTDPETPTLSTTPDSGFYTPSQFEPSSNASSASINPFFTSTPRRSKSAGPQTSTPCLTETPKRFRCEGINERFTDLCNAMDWDSLDDSGGMSEDPKEGNDSGEGESSPNSSLRSVQWLKGFSIGDSVKPLLSSPPTPGCKDQNQQSKVSDSNKTNGVGSSTSTATTTRGLISNVPCFSSPSLTPLPVIMAPRVPTYLQTCSRIAASTSMSAAASSSSTSASSSSLLLSSSLPSSSTASSSLTSIQGALTLNTSQDANTNINGNNSKKNGQRKALEELKMNKPEKNIGRSKYTGKIFSRPGYSYMDLIKMAMQTSEEGEMTLKQIVTWIEDHFPFFKHEAKDSWKSSIRHNLSLHSDFMKADDKKHGCKWKLCNDVAQPNLHVPAPQEMTSAQTAFLKRVKKNAPQPILPKVNAYALVPIHNLTNSITDGSQPQQDQQLLPQPLPRKPVHILPKQREETFVHSVNLNQQGQDTERSNFDQQFHTQLVSQISHQPDQYHVIQQLLHQGPQHHAMAVSSTLFEDQSLIGPSDYISNTPSGIYQSSDSNSSHTLGFSSLRMFDQSVPMTSQYVDNNVNDGSISNVGIDDGVQAPSNFPYTMEQMNSTVLSECSVQAMPSSQKNNHHQDFPLDAVFEVRQEKGGKPGEKKIVFVLQDSENNKRQKNQKIAEVTKRNRIGVGNCHGINNDSYRSRKFKKNLSEVFVKQDSAQAKSLTDMNSFNFGGSKKKFKEGQRTNRQCRGPVLNLQSVLQNSAEDKKASDTIGLLLQEEDEGKRLGCEDGGQSSNGFTRIRSFSERESSHLNSHMQRALQEQTANIMSHAGLVKDGSRTLDKDGNVERLHFQQQILPKAGSRLLPFPLDKKEGLSFRDIRDRMSLAKNKNIMCCDDNGAVDPLQTPSSKKAGSFQDNVCGLSPLRSSTKSASQLVFRHMSSGEHGPMSLASSDSSHSHSSSSNVHPSGNMSKSTGSSSRRVGNILRSKSRRKQVHVPLTVEISPVRAKSHAIPQDEDSSVFIVDDENAQFINISDESSHQGNYDYSIVAATSEQQPVSALSTEIRQPSLKILQEKPLEQYQHATFTSVKEKPLKDIYIDVADDISLSDFQINSGDVNKVIESIFTCSSSPIKEEMTDVSSFSSSDVATNDRSNHRDPLFSSELDTPPGVLHFLSTFPNDTELPSQNLSDDNYHKAVTSMDNRISITPTSDNHLHQTNNIPPPFLSPTNHFLLTPSPPSRYSQKRSVPSKTATSTGKKISPDGDDESQGFVLPKLSPIPISREIGDNTSHVNGSNFLLPWSTSMSSMDTPPCGTILGTSSTSAATTAESTTSVSKSPRCQSSNILVAFVEKHLKENNNSNEDRSTLMPLDIIKREQEQNQEDQDTLAPLGNVLKYEITEDEPPSILKSYYPSSSSSSTASSATTSSLSTLSSSDLTLCSLITPPCGGMTGTSSISNGSIGSGGATIAPLFVSVAGTSNNPLFLSPSSSSSSSANNNNNSSQQLQQTPEILSSFTPESLSSILDPSLMENLDVFINSLPGLSPGFPNIQLSPHS